MPDPIDASVPSDFDFVLGDWTVRHRQLSDRLVGSTDWVEFDGTMSTRAVMGGFGNIEDNLVEAPAGAYRAVALRSYDALEGSWSIWWLDGRAPHRLDVPVVGRFIDGVGTFLAEDSLRGRPIRVRFVWTRQHDDALRWEQAFSGDDGANWEINWEMEFTRVSS